MKDRLLKGWTFIRVFYLAMGLIIATHSAMNMEWMGAVLGAYFASMGLFSFGCAAGQCYVQYKEPIVKESKEVLR
jgi:hypothetical protein